MIKKFFSSSFIRNQAGNAIVTLFGAAAVVGMIGGGTMTLMRGPLKTMLEVNQRTMAEGQLVIASKMVLLDAQNLSAPDCDSDKLTEARSWRDHGDNGPDDVAGSDGGGFIPNEIGINKRDSWGTQYGYCVWDHGSLTVSDDVAGCGGNTANRLEGGNSIDYPAYAIISAGPDTVFETPCVGWTDGDMDGLPDADLITAGGDDIVIVYTYAEAAQDNPGLWTIDVDATDPTRVETKIAEQTEFTGSDSSFGGRVELQGARGLLLPDELQLPGCGGSEEGQIRRNMSFSPPVLQICESNAWVTMGTGGGSSPAANTDSLSDGLVAYWELDETSGADISDSSANTNDGTWTDGSGNVVTQETITGVIGDALTFDGTDDKITVSDDDTLDITDAITLSAWVFPHTASGASDEQIFISKHAGGGNDENYKFGFDATNAGTYLTFSFRNNPDVFSYRTTNAELDLNSWSHVLVTYESGSDAVIYINGSAVAVTQTSGGSDPAMTATSDDVVLGGCVSGCTGGNAGAFDGLLDDIRVYERVLTSEEIAALGGTSYVAQANVTQASDATHLISTIAWLSQFDSDTGGDEVGYGFRIDGSLLTSDTATASVTAYRMANPGRSNLIFSTNDGASLSEGLVMDYEGGIGLLVGKDADLDAHVQIGAHYTSWDTTNLVRGLLATADDATTDQLAYFGLKGTDDYSASLLFSKDLKLQSSNTAGSTISEHVRFDSSQNTIFFGDLVQQADGSDVQFRHKYYSGTAGNNQSLIFEQYRGTEGVPAAVVTGDDLGTIKFRAYDGTSLVSDSHAAIWAEVNGTVAAGNVEIDLLIGTSETGDATANERLRITSDGLVGIGVSDPQADLHVSGRAISGAGIQIGNDTNCSDSEDANTVRYNDDANDPYQYCDGNDWQNFSIGTTEDADDLEDCSPIPFNFHDIHNVSASTEFTTNTIIVGGLVSDSCKLQVASSGSVTVNKNGADESGEITDIVNGDLIQIKITSAASAAEYVKTYVSIGDKTDEILVQTQGKIAFVTSETFDGDLGGIDGADAECQRLADDADLDGTFLAWLSTDTAMDEVENRFGLYDGGYYLTNGTKVADDWADLTTPSLDSAINRDENEASRSGDVWTATGTGGASFSGNHCDGWTSNSSGDSARYGDASSSTGTWTSTNNGNCNTSKRLYCFEQ